jgi:hypothetical protein
MRISSILLLLMVGVLYSSPGLAFEGRYRAGDKTYRQNLTIKKQGADSYHVEFVVGTEGCSGYFEGTGRVQGATLVVGMPPPPDPLERCTVSILRKGSKLEVKEDDCTMHGASCEFAGTYKKR